MKAITLYEPWASLMAIGAKQNETRPRNTSYRGDIAIHAGKSKQGFLDADVRAATLKAFAARKLRPAMNSFGCIVAVVELWDVQPAEKFFPEEWLNRPADLRSKAEASGGIPTSREEFQFGNYAPGRWIYRTRNLRRLATPIPTRGYQSIGWTVPPDIAARVDAEVRIWLNRCIKNEVSGHCNCEGCIADRRS